MSSDFAWNQEQGVWKIFEPILPSAAECVEGRRRREKPENSRGFLSLDIRVLLGILSKKLCKVLVPNLQVQTGGNKVIG